MGCCCALAAAKCRKGQPIPSGIDCDLATADEGSFRGRETNDRPTVGGDALASPVQVVRTSREDADRATDRIGAIEDGARPLHHFDAFDREGVDGVPILVGSVSKDGVVESNAVDEKEIAEHFSIVICGHVCSGLLLCR